MQQAGRDENRQEQACTTTEGTEQAGVRTPETQKRHRKVVGCLLQVTEGAAVISDKGRVVNVSTYD
jgi:hypothetical protein